MPVNPLILDQMKPHWKRFLKSFRPGNWSDITHSFVNLFVEFARADPYRLGHWIVYSWIALLVLAIGGVKLVWP